jgi:hypothetical protein
VSGPPRLAVKYDVTIAKNKLDWTQRIEQGEPFLKLGCRGNFVQERGCKLLPSS